MKAKECLRQSARLLELYVKKATSYKVVKGKLNYRWYNDEFLQDRIKVESNTTDKVDSKISI